MKTCLPCLLAIALVATPAAAHDPVEPAPSATVAGLPERPAGSNEVLRAPLALADGLEVIVSDVVIPPGGQVPRHWHPGQEFLYVVEGTAIHVQEGQDDIELGPGEGYVIPARAVHAPRGGPDGTRAVVFRVHVAGEEERILVPAE